jgi:hypothetical protein
MTSGTATIRQAEVAIDTTIGKARIQVSKLPPREHDKHLRGRGISMRNFFIAMTRNPISLLGAAITTASALVILSLVAVDVVGYHENPYMGILAFVILPGLFLFGLALIPIGTYRERRAERKAAERGEERHPNFPVIDLNSGKTRKAALLFVALTGANLVILATATYKGVEVMDSTAFCGTTCHTVMIPEYTAYMRSPHARVNCVACHIGPGANWFVKSKLSGAWQLVSVALDLFPRPIPTPIHNLRPARDTCEQCHWPTKFVGDKLRVETRYQEDEENTETKTVLLLRVGGIQGRESHGIHWHVDPSHQIRYRSDPTRETIYDVELTDADGTVTLFRNGQPEEGAEHAEWRTMDCVDCHNRPTHVYRAPGEELDAAIQEGAIASELPYVRREGRKLLQAEYASHEEARSGIQSGLAAFYQQDYPEVASAMSAEIGSAAEAIGNIYASNVFPVMNVGWDTYPDHIGHEQSSGCFRCHNDEHESDDGQLISQDCDTCHSLLAMEEESPEVLEMLSP